MVLIAAARPEVSILYRRVRQPSTASMPARALEPGQQSIRLPKGTGPVESIDVRSALVPATGEFDTERDVEINRRWRCVDSLRVLPLLLGWMPLQGGLLVLKSTAAIET